MPFCPNCRSEYIQGIETCADCGERLVAELEPLSAAEPIEGADSLVLASIIPSPMWANMVKDILDQEGIFCALQGAHTAGQLAGMAAIADGQVRVLVPESKVREAKEIINDFLNGMDMETRRIECPHCGQSIEDYRIVCPKCGGDIEID